MISPMEINENVKKFIEDNISYIENKDLDSIRNSVLESSTSIEDTHTIYKVIREVIDYHELLDKASIIPGLFFVKDTICELVVPSNIKSIADYGIFDCDILRLFIAQSPFILNLNTLGFKSEISNITQLRPICLHDGDTFRWISESLIEWEIGGDIFFRRLSFNPFPALYRRNPNIRLIIHKDVKIGVLNDPHQVSLLKYAQEYSFKNIEVVA